MEVIYTASATSVGGRNGRVKTSDGILDLELMTPGSKIQEDSQATNPEQLFAAGYAACFNGALKLAAQLKKIRTGETKITVNVSLGKDEKGGFIISAHISALIPGVDKGTAEELVDDAYNICPYSKATRNNIATTLSILEKA